MKLGDICTIESGLILSRKRARNEMEIKRYYKVLTLNNIEPHGDFNEKVLEQFPSNEVLQERYFTKIGDVLIRLNEPYTSVCIQRHQENVLIPSYFVSLEITDDHFLPEYVSWFLNSNIVKRQFYQAQSGTRTPNINQHVIRNLNIPKIPLYEQEKITAIHQLYVKERRLLTQLIEEKDRYYKAITNHLIESQMEEL